MKGRVFRAILIGSTALLPLSAAMAQTAPAPAPQPAADEPTAGDIVVTGTRIIRNGTDAPTPVSVITDAEIAKAAPVTIADYVNLLPALNGSQTPRTSNSSTGGGVTGANLLNLRNLGVNRTLVLLDGRRVAPSTATGAVDINTLPQALVQRVDVVTGGASAAWGSDAVSGVVNFILDTKFTGIKGNIQGGVTQEGDGVTYGGDLSWGTKFAGDRGHIVLSGQYSKQEDALLRKRGWYAGYKLLVNPNYTTTNGQPLRLILPNTFVNLTKEGLIISGPLRGTAFDANGGVATTNFPFAPIANGFLQSGGTQNFDMTLDVVQVLSPTEQGSIFGHASYELTDDINMFVEGSYGQSRSGTMTGYFWKVGNEPIQIDNAYLPASVRTAMTNAGITSFNLSSPNRPIGVPTAVTDRSLIRGVIGFDGRIGSKWRWNAYYQYGETNIDYNVRNNIVPANANASFDAVLSGGQIVCRSTITAPTNGCVPYNPFGERAITDAQKAWMTGTSQAKVAIRQHVAEANIQGEVFDLPAGPLSTALGVNYRRESGGVISADANSTAGRWYVGNFAPFYGEVTVKEAFGEVAVPVFKDSPIGQSLDLNGAIRYTDYSTSGSVVTWKVGGTYKPVDGLEFRVTHSRDIRAPNFNELFQAGSTLVQFVNDSTKTGSPSIQVLQTTSGNRNLTPEKASSWTAGVVLKPRFMPGFDASIDYYDISISDAIAVNSSQQIINQCAAGSALFCSALTRDAAGNLTAVAQVPFNARSEVAAGIDFEAGYRTGLGGGNLDLRVLANYVTKLAIVSPFGTVTRAGEVGNNLGTSQGSPTWKLFGTVTYNLEPVTFQLKTRFIGASKIESDYGPLDVNLNDVPAIAYFDAFIGYDLKIGGGKVQIYAAVDNLLNQSPPVVVNQDPAVNQAPGSSTVIYDLVGRSFRAGVRFKF